MSREIKYRQFVNDDFTYWGYSVMAGYPRDFVKPRFPLSPSDEYINIDDKNDRKIYTNDIVRILYTDWPSKNDSDPRTLKEYLRDIAHVGKVVFNPYYGYRVEDIGGMNCGEHGYIELIGNIYENPELLK